MIYLIVGLGFIIDILFIVHDDEKHDALSIVLKTLASLIFVVLSIYLHVYYNNTSYGIWIILALIADMIGDFILILRNIDNKHKDLIFVLGTLFFFIGHIFLMILLYINDPSVLGKSLIVTVIFFCLGGIKLLKSLEASKSLLTMGGIYLFFIAYILAYSFCSCLNNATNFDRAFLFGYFLFMVSDVILMYSKFNKSSSKTLQPIYRLMYFISQVLIATTIALI